MGEYPYRIHIRHGDFELDVEGDQAFVESYIGAFLAEGEIPESAPSGSGKKLPSKARPRTVPEGRRRKGLREVPAEELKAFMKGKRFEGNKERYLEYLRFWKRRGVGEVSDADMHACYLAEGLGIPPTGRQNFLALRSEGLVKAGSKRGLWALVEGGKALKGTFHKKAVKKPARKRR